MLRIFNGGFAVVATIVLALGAGPALAQLDKDQQKCLNSINKDGSKVAKAQGKENTSCVKNKTKGKLDGQTVDECLRADTKGKVGKAADKVTKTANDRCQGASQPDFGFTNATRINDAATGEEILLTEEVFGTPVDDAVSTEKDAAKCQTGVQKAYEKYAATRVKEFLKCKKAGLKDVSITDAASLESSCMWAPDTKNKVAKAQSKIEGAVAKCAAVLAAAFPGDCSGSVATAADLAECLATRSDCRMCKYLNEADDLSAECDLIDNDVLDGTCPGCGNGAIDPGEECDDGLGNSDTTPDACRTDCTLPFCGDGITDPGFGEDCDDVGESATCNSDCTTSVCPDGKLNVTAGEECDDGNLIDDDFCSNTCTQPPQDPSCPSVGELTLLAGTRSTPCTTDSDCEIDGVLVGSCNTGLGLCQTATGLDTGWKGLAQGQDINDEVVASGLLYCPGPFDGLSPEPCGVCEVQGLDPATDFCRCNNDNQAICSDTFGLDPGSCSIGLSCSADADCKVCSQNTGVACAVTDDCPLGPSGDEICLNGNRQPTCSGGQCVGICECYFGPPLPLSAGNVPACALNKFAEDIRGTANVDLGSGEIATNLRAIVFLGELITVPCPYCAGDTTANDGVRDGTCVLGDNDGDACDVQGVNNTFPSPSGEGHSLDCFPSVGKNVTGAGIRIPIKQTTGTSTLESNIPCGFDFAPMDGVQDDLCPCGTCEVARGEICASNADCTEFGGGECNNTGANEPRPNNCAVDGICSDLGGGLQGECNQGPDNVFCDGVSRANGEPFVACISNADCDNTECGGGVGPGLCGTCSETRTLPCFLPTITATGTADPDAPIGVATFCIPKTSNPGVNGAVGLPGPARVTNQSRARTFCASDAGTEYIPGTGGCP